MKTILFICQSGLGMAKAAFSEQPLSKYVNQIRQKKSLKIDIKINFDQNSNCNKVLYFNILKCTILTIR